MNSVLFLISWSGNQFWLKHFVFHCVFCSDISFFPVYFLYVHYCLMSQHWFLFFLEMIESRAILWVEMMISLFFVSQSSTILYCGICISCSMPSSCSLFCCIWVAWISGKCWFIAWNQLVQWQMQKLLYLLPIKQSIKCIYKVSWELFLIRKKTLMIIGFLTLL